MPSLHAHVPPWYTGAQAVTPVLRGQYLRVLMVEVLVASELVGPGGAQHGVKRRQQHRHHVRVAGRRRELQRDAAVLRGVGRRRGGGGAGVERGAQGRGAGNAWGGWDGVDRLVLGLWCVPGGGEGGARLGQDLRRLTDGLGMMGGR